MSAAGPPTHPGLTPAALQTTDDADRRQRAKQYWPITRASNNIVNQDVRAETWQPCWAGFVAGWDTVEASLSFPGRGVTWRDNQLDLQLSACQSRWLTFLDGALSPILSLNSEKGNHGPTAIQQSERRPFRKVFQIKLFVINCCYPTNIVTAANSKILQKQLIVLWQQNCSSEH